MKQSQKRHANPAVEMDPARLDPILREKWPGQRVGDRGMRNDVNEHANAAFTLPGGHFIGLKGKVRDEMRENEPPEYLHNRRAHSGAPLHLLILTSLQRRRPNP